MDIKRALPRPELRGVVRSFQERRAELGSAVLTWPVPARPHQILNIHLAQPYRVRIEGGLASATPESSVVGLQTYRRAHVYLSGSLHVFNILFQPTGLNRLVGIDMTSLLNHDPAAEDVLGRSAVTLGDAVRAASDFPERVAAVERWVGMMLDKSEPDGAIGHILQRSVALFAGSLDELEDERLVAVARLRLLCRAAGVTEVSAASAATLRLAPMTLPDSVQVRLARMYPGARYRATTSTVQVPIPRAGGVGAPRIRDLELVQMVADLLRALDGKPGESTQAITAKEERQAR